jgi:hypothetical protein
MPPKSSDLSELHGVTTQKTVLFTLICYTFVRIFVIVTLINRRLENNPYCSERQVAFPEFHTVTYLVVCHH